MSKAKQFVETLQKYLRPGEKGGGTAGEIRRYEKALGIEPVDLEKIEDVYDYLDDLKDKASAKGLTVK